MPGQTTDLIKEKLDIAEFLRGYLTLQPAGKNFKALCPFHKEKTPSFHVNPDRGFFHCFGCGVGGDVFKFLELHDKVGFADAVKQIAKSGQGSFLAVLKDFGPQESVGMLSFPAPGTTLALDLPNGWAGTGFNHWVNDDAFDDQGLIRDDIGQVAT